MKLPILPDGFAWNRWRMPKVKASQNILSAETALIRLRWIVAMDRTKQDGRNRIAKLYGTGHRILFDTPLSILPDEEVVLDYEMTAEGVSGYAIVQRSSPC